MQGWYWEFPKSPTTSTNWAVRLNNQMDAIAEGGITYVWLPPLSRGAFGGFSVGYDPKDLYDLGEYGLGATGFGTRSEVDALITKMQSLGVVPVADVIYNHRDGGLFEANPAVEGWIENFSFSQAAANNSPYPSDRWRCVLPLGGTTGNDAGDYYFKISSASQHPNFHDAGYTLYMWTNRKGFQGLTPLTEAEPNGGGDCGQSFNTIQVGRDMQASVDAFGCTADEFYLNLSSSDYFAAGDTLYITMVNTGGYSDHRIYGIWSALRSTDIQNELIYQTPTDFTQVASGRGQMDWRSFRPNGAPTTLAGDWEFPWFFFDYDSYAPGVQDTLSDWTQWLFEEVGIGGLRADAVKHFPPDVLGNILTDLHNLGYDPGMIVGEFFDYNGFTLDNWVNNVESSMSPGAASNIEVRAFDFGLRQALKDACDAFGYDARNVYNSGMVDGGPSDGFKAVTFVNNHDFRDFGQPIQNDPMLGYAYILTNNKVGVPSIYHPDYFGEARPNAPTVTLKEPINDLIAAHKNFIVGSVNVDYLNRFGTPYGSSYASGGPSSTLLYQMGNNPASVGVLNVINFAGSDLEVTHFLNTASDMHISPGDTLWLVAGSANQDFLVVNGASQVSIDIPGRSHALFANCDRPANPTGLIDLSFCPSDSVPTLSVDDLGGNYEWYDAAVGGTRLAQGASFTPEGAGVYYVENTGACGSSDRVAVTLSADIAACNCSAPTNAIETGVTTSTAGLAWDEVADATGYQAQGRITGTTTFRARNLATPFALITGLTPGESYDWQVRAYCSGDFSDWTDLRTFTLPTLKIDFDANLEIFPNPTADMIQISGTGSGEVVIELFDLTGRSVMQQSAQDQFLINWNLADLAAGNYWIRVSDEEQSKQYSIVKVNKD